MSSIKNIDALLDLKKQLTEIQNIVDASLKAEFGQNRPHKCKKKEVKKLDLDDCMNLVSKTLGMTDDQVSEFMNSILGFYPIAAVQMLVKAASKLINQRYTDNIRDYEKVYIISTVNTAVCALPKQSIASYDTIAYFRTFADAMEAKQALLDVLTEVFRTNEE